MRLSKDQAQAIAEQIVTEAKVVNHKEREAYKKTAQYKTKHAKILKALKSIDQDIRRMIEYDIWIIEPRYVEELIMRQKFGERHRLKLIKVVAAHVKAVAIEAKTIDEIKAKVDPTHHDLRNLR